MKNDFKIWVAKRTQNIEELKKLDELFGLTGDDEKKATEKANKYIDAFKLNLGLSEEIWKQLSAETKGVVSDAMNKIIQAKVFFRGTITSSDLEVIFNAMKRVKVTNPDGTIEPLADAVGIVNPMQVFQRAPRTIKTTWSGVEKKYKMEPEAIERAREYEKRRREEYLASKMAKPPEEPSDKGPIPGPDASVVPGSAFDKISPATQDLMKDLFEKRINEISSKIDKTAWASIATKGSGTAAKIAPYTAANFIRNQKQLMSLGVYANAEIFEFKTLCSLIENLGGDLKKITLQFKP